MNSIVFLKGEHIIDGLAGVPPSATKRIIELKYELFNTDGTMKMNTNIELQVELLKLLKKRTILWRAKLN